MYMPFVMSGYALGLVLGLLACQLVDRTIPGLRGIRELRWTLIAGIASVLLFAVRPWTPAWLTIVSANYVLFAALILVYKATADVLRKRAWFVPWATAICLATLPAFIYYTYFRDVLVARILLSSGPLSIIAAATALLLFRYPSPSESARVLGWIQVADAALHAVRCVLTVLYPPSDMIRQDLIQAGFSYIHLILCGATICGVLWLSICEQRSELQQMARTDSLTGLLNRRAFDEILSRQHHRSRLAGDRLGMILIDLDKFKEINDTWGHSAGDEVIRRVSMVLAQMTRPADALARYGGEEFVLLLRDVTVEQARVVAERLRQQIEQMPAAPGATGVTASIGVAISYAGETVADFFARCDHALYRSKRAGRNLVTLCDSAERQPQLSESSV